MEWISEPTAWAGLATLVVLEIVLGIDNLVFIAILADKLPPHQRDKARVIGLSLALVMRLILLSVMSWMITLTRPLFSIGPLSFAGRDLILLIGGLFLLFKATVELHERLEGNTHNSDGSRAYASFWIVVAQIIVLDAVFSLDAVITAVGMVEHLAVMMIAVVIAMGIMLIASKPLTAFVNRHPTVVVLCLAFLLMIGFSLVAEGLGFHVPKGYLYAAIGFSILIESFNQIAQRNILRLDASRPMRERTAEAILNLLSTKKQREQAEQAAASPSAMDAIQADQGFGVEERNMVSGVLTLVDRSVRSIMTPRTDISWVNLEDDPASIRQLVKTVPHSFFPVCRGNLDDVVGVGRARDLLADVLTGQAIRRESLRQPIIVHESIGILQLMDTLRRSRGQLVLVTDEFGNIEGLVTPIDVFEAIAGEFPDEDEMPEILPDGEGRWLVTGAADLHHVEQTLEVQGLVTDEYSTLAGYLLARFDHLPDVGQVLVEPGIGLRFTVREVVNRRIVSVLVERIAPEHRHDGVAG
ncbi:TerC family protein [Verticiella sediminum]|uniref:TerC family protein n=1 Tax=Verticiella sediminum TaxID=1247510 RepID=A0A556AUN1_9BURK|nr:TerC family protein [Verticiella sediminum]TSH96659.1 TerC family protein [Verticiella sediminum]